MVLRRIRKCLLSARLGLRELLKKPMRKRLGKLSSKRTRLVQAGIGTAKIDREIRYWKERAGNESVYGTANTWLTPLSRIMRAKISNAKRILKKSLKPPLKALEDITGKERER